MKNHGFTLIEVLVALAIVALIGIMSFTGLMTSVKFNEITLSRMDVTSQLILADETMKRDLMHALNRLPRDKRGESYKHSFYGVNPRLEGNMLAFSIHTGSNISNDIGAIRYVKYVLENNIIKRIESKFVDQTDNTEVRTTVFLTNVEDISLKFNLGEQWVDEWPMSNWTSNNGLPKIIELTYEIEGVGQIMRKYMLPSGAI